LVSLAQQSGKIPRIGVLWHAGNEQEEAIYLGPLRQGLNALGYFEGKNIELLNRFADEHYDRFDALAAELVEAKVDVIVAVVASAAFAAKRATNKLPVIFVGLSDPVGQHVVDSSSNERFRNMYGPQNVEFAAHIGLYTPCNVTYRDDNKITGKPIRLFYGMADDWVSIEPCRAYVARLKSSGADAALTEYAGAYHAFDAFMLKEALKFPQAQTTRHCLLAEGDAGDILNSKTGKRYDLNDPCVERGTTVAYNEEATTGTTKAVKELLTTLPPVALTKN
jgi:hypothetical protein